MNSSAISTLLDLRRFDCGTAKNIQKNCHLSLHHGRCLCHYLWKYLERAKSTHRLSRLKPWASEKMRGLITKKKTLKTTEPEAKWPPCPPSRRACLVLGYYFESGGRQHKIAQTVFRKIRISFITMFNIISYTLITFTSRKNLQ